MNENVLLLQVKNCHKRNPVIFFMCYNISRYLFADMCGSQFCNFTNHVPSLLELMKVSWVYYRKPHECITHIIANKLSITYKRDRNS